uniref:Uncharacterized protein n=1 Tax=Cacopsylla melanoneura TaxID=428564 RepID=A0A8D8ZH19_9HEMI
MGSQENHVCSQYLPRGRVQEVCPWLLKVQVKRKSPVTTTKMEPLPFLTFLLRPESIKLLSSLEKDTSKAVRIWRKSLVRAEKETKSPSDLVAKYPSLEKYLTPTFVP